MKTTVQIFQKLFIFAFFFTLGLFFAPKVSAQDRSFYYSKIHIEINVNKDSTMDISETMTYHFTGTYRELYRQITLEDISDINKCKSDESAQCGGFEFMIVKDVLDGNGKSLAGKYKEYEVDSSSDRRYEVAWEFAPGGRSFNGEDFTWTVKYKIFGGLGYFDEYDLFYWNLLFEDRAESVKDFSSRINFPSDISFDDSKLKVFGNFTYNYYYDRANHSLDISSENVPGYSDYTVLLQLPKKVVNKYSFLDLELSPSPQDVEVEGKTLNNVETRLYGLPGGKNTLTFKKDGYYPKTVQINLEAGKSQKLEVKLEETPFHKFVRIALIAINASFCIALPVFAYFLYAWWNRKGRDRGGRKTIVPWFEPPDKVPPYLLGSLKDERVDLNDITGTIIDLAYRGFIKIKEIGNKKVTGYEFIKKKDFVSEELTNSEKQILFGIFGDLDSVTTEDLKYEFYTKLAGIKDNIYEEMVAKTYFDRRPDRVRTKYLVYGIVGIVIGYLLLQFLSFTGIFMPQIALVASGAMVVFISFFMPAKTPKGTEINEEIKGFRMYLYTAERFKVQKLKPETFEKYLSYAIVFGIEKEWAKKFKDIYKKMPDWYEGRSGSFVNFDSVYFANSISNFNRSSQTTFTSSPNSGGGLGGGFSSGGGFSGGFSGGGGGGGGGGAR